MNRNHHTRQKEKERKVKEIALRINLPRRKRSIDIDHLSKEQKQKEEMRLKCPVRFIKQRNGFHPPRESISCIRMGAIECHNNRKVSENAFQILIVTLMLMQGLFKS
ncbi:hypothetical protein CEXT_400201 [Caerostris extrusa]|uniref:Uncharacterized protein n=1 Tax=Caerostris extrusa TaxID=172846 RepID=A0AAV4Y0V6_CAEEX|nr:hypothetical protein CEXT_400201 [Caerostris extrusa]